MEARARRIRFSSQSSRFLRDIRWVSTLLIAERRYCELMPRRHGGKEVSKYLKENLHSLLETVQPDSIGDTVQWMVNTHEGYYRRWRGGRLQRWTRFSQSNLPDLGSGMTLEERITLAFLEVSPSLYT